MKARDIMTTHVVSVQPDVSVKQVAEIMVKRGISAVPVVDSGGKIVGIVSEGDFLRRVETGTVRQRPRWLEFVLGPGRLAEDYARSHGRKVGEVMSAPPVTIAEDATLPEIVQVMERRRIKRLPVMRGDKLVGIVSRANLVRALASVAREVKPADVADWTIREQIEKVLRKEPWSPMASIEVTVRNGVVDLWGTILDGRERKALVVAIENVSGVKAVHDHLVWIEPTSGMVIDEPPSAASGTKAR